MKYIIDISRARRKKRAGNKAWSLALLAREGFGVPVGRVLTAQAHRAYLENETGLLDQVRRELKDFIRPGIRYAIRSSAGNEDSKDHSFAGQYLTLLNVQELENVLDAILKVWDSGIRITETGYGPGLGPGKRYMAVIIQEMVDARWSGVGFSINPVTGREEIIVECMEGTGEKMVQDGANPHRWVYHSGKWDTADQADSPGRDILQQLAEGIKRIKRLMKTDVDVEWAFDGTSLYYLQSRPVTGHTYPAVYSNHISRGFLPGLIKPLVWSVNIPLVNSAWLRLLKKLLGPLDIQPEDLSRAFFYRTYFNMGTMGMLFEKLGLPRKSLEYLMGLRDPSDRPAFRPGLRSIRYLPRMTWFLLTNLWLGVRFERWIIGADNSFDQLNERLERDFPLKEYDELFSKVMERAREAAYFNIIIPIAMQVFNQLLNRKLKRHGISSDALNFSADFPLLRDYDPAFGIRRLHNMFQLIPLEFQDPMMRYEGFRSACSEEFGFHSEDNSLKQFLTAFDELLKRYGFFSESGNDFSYPHWSEVPDLVLGMIRNTGNQEGNEVEYQEKFRRYKGSAFRRAGRYRLFREMISAAYTRDYGLFRKLFLRTGTHLAEKGLIRERDDVFYLTLEEHDQLVRSANRGSALRIREKIEQRKQEMSDYEEISLPSVIYGETAPPVALEDKSVMRGIPASPGQFSGKIIVVRGYRDFYKKVDGAILVIPFADVGWTPMLTRAGAIVSESGGMLSHAAIVARELSIPSISSVEHACSLEDGLDAVVDGYQGILVIKKEVNRSNV